VLILAANIVRGYFLTMILVRGYDVLQISQGVIIGSHNIHFISSHVRWLLGTIDNTYMAMPGIASDCAIHVEIALLKERS
jgi:hypothetical protein